MLQFKLSMPSEKLDKKTWKTLRVRLNNSYDYNTTWEKVINLFRQRIEHFYFDPIESILAPQSKKGEGFSILTLQCALIEMFAAFRTGTIYNRNKPRTGGLAFEYKSSSQRFIGFLYSENIFENHFYIIKPNGDKRINYPYDANDFYDKVRCGLMHEARTKEDWRITANPKKASGKNVFIGIDSEKQKVIHRSKLHDSMKSYFEKYLLELRDSNNQGKQLRRFLGRKLDHLHSLPRDLAYEWWMDT